MHVLTMVLCRGRRARLSEEASVVSCSHLALCVRLAAAAVAGTHWVTPFVAIVQRAVRLAWALAPSTCGALVVCIHPGAAGI